MKKYLLINCIFWLDLILLNFLIFFCLIVNYSFSQENKIVENLILQKKYLEADSILKEKIKNSDKVSSDLTFLFGKNSFFLNKYKQSINWLNKYLELRGQAGKYSDETIKFLELSNTKLLIETEKDIKIISKSIINIL